MRFLSKKMRDIEARTLLRNINYDLKVMIDNETIGDKQIFKWLISKLNSNLNNTYQIVRFREKQK